MNSRNVNPNNSDVLTQYIDAVVDQEPETARADIAQRKLIARLDRAETGIESGNGGPRWGWAATAAAAVLLPMLLWMPAPNGSLAFADVQRHFTGFETLTAHLTTRVGDADIVAMTIRVDERDRTRLDAGSGFSYIIDPNQALMLQLFHEQQQALLVPLAGAGPIDETPGLDWLADIREFQGQAELLDETALIRGREAFGFKLKIEGLDMTLWAAESGEPLRLGMAGPGGIETRVDFQFDRALDEAAFSLELPPGYRLPDSDRSGEDRD